jgi:hypothetical protein
LEESKAHNTTTAGERMDQRQKGEPYSFGFWCLQPFVIVDWLGREHQFP